MVPGSRYRPPMDDRAVEYDEFGLLHENAAEWGLPFDGPPPLRRARVEVEPGRGVSAIVWGDDDPRLVLLHGGGQNAHTWDTVALALGLPCLAIDLPNHGHSDPAPRGPHDVDQHGRDVAVAIRALAPRAGAVVGMSLGGLTAIALTAHAPELVRRLVLVDVTPSGDDAAAAPIRQFLDGPESFASLDEVLERTVRFNPTRSAASLRRGVLHNTVRRADGRWVWRHQRVAPATDDRRADPARLWNALESTDVPVVLIRGLAAGTLVDAAAVAELCRRRPDARVEVVPGAGHSIQGDQPLKLARLIEGVL